MFIEPSIGIHLVTTTLIFSLNMGKVTVAFSSHRRWDRTASLSLAYLHKNVMISEDNYLLIIHSYSKYKDDLLFTNPVIRVIFHEHHTFSLSKISLSCRNHRHGIPLNILLSPWFHTVWETNLRRLLTFSLESRNLLAFTSTEGDNIRNLLDTFSSNRDVSNLPALKIAFHFHVNNGALRAWIVGLGYSNEDLERLMQIPSNLHKLLFRTFAIRVQALIWVREPLYLHHYSGERLACPRLIKERSLDVAMCTRGLTEAITLASVHNFTIEIFEKGVERHKVDESRQNQVIEAHTVWMHYDRMPLYFRSGLLFQDFISIVPIYCQAYGLEQNFEDTLSLEAMIWVMPFSAGLWLCILICLVLISGIIAFSASMKASEIPSIIFTEIVLLLGQCEQKESTLNLKSRGILISVSFLSVFLGNAFSNSITSLVVAPSLPHTMENLRELLTVAHYKIIWFSIYYKERPEDTYRTSFEIKGMSEWLDKSFLEIPGKFPGVKNMADYLHGKFAILNDNYYAREQELYLEKELNSRRNDSSRNSEVTKCHSVTEYIRGHPRFWKMYTINRRWLSQTILRIQEGGISKHDDERAAWAVRLWRKFPLFDPSPTRLVLANDQINFGRLVVIFMFCAGAYSICFALFCVEVISKCLRREKVVILI